jgi:hypothetical protein
MFKKSLLVLAAAVLASAVLGGPSAAYSLLDFQSAVDALTAVDPTIDPPPNDPNRDFAVGGFQGSENNNVGFSAHSGPTGQDAQGKVSETRPQFFGTSPSTYQGRFRVICLAVAVKEAALGLVPTEATSNDQGDEFILTVYDSGLHGGTGDRWGFIPFVDASACEVGLVDPVFDLFPIERGNIVVNDALP